MKQLPVDYRTPEPQKHEIISIPSTFRAFARIKSTKRGKTSAAWHTVQGSRGVK